MSKWINEFIGMWIRAFKTPNLKNLAENSEKASEMVSVEAEKRMGKASKGLPFILVICALIIAFTDIVLAGLLAVIIVGYTLLVNSQEKKTKKASKKVTKKKVVKKVIKKSTVSSDDEDSEVKDADSEGDESDKKDKIEE